MEQISGNLKTVAVILRTYAAITGHGKAFMNRIFQHCETKIDEIFEQLAHEDIDQVIELLKGVGNKVVKLYFFKYISRIRDIFTLNN